MPTYSSEQATEEEDPSGRVAAALGRLSASDREAITLIAWDGLRPATAAAVLGQSPTASRVRLHRAKCRLRRELDRGVQADLRHPTQIRSQGDRAMTPTARIPDEELMELVRTADPLVERRCPMTDEGAAESLLREVLTVAARERTAEDPADRQIVEFS